MPTVEELREQSLAEALLAKLDVLEDLAELHDDEPVVAIRQQVAGQFREAIGVFPEKRFQLRGALERIVAGGRQRVAEVIEMLGTPT